jgi:WD40 repeat protein
MDYKQKYLKYKQKYLNLLKDQKGGKPFLMDLLAGLVFSYLFERNQRQLQLIYTGRQPVMMQPLGNFTLNLKYRLILLGRSGLSIVLATRLVEIDRRNRLVEIDSRNRFELQLAKRIMGRMAWMSREQLKREISPLTCIATIPEQTKEVTSVAFHPSLPLLACGYADRIMILWDCSQNPPTPKTTITHTHRVVSVAFHPTQPFLASGLWDRTVKLWDCSDAQNPILKANLTGHNNQVTSVAFHTTLKLLACGSADNSADNTVKLWDYSDPQNPPMLKATIPAHTKEVTSVSFHPTLPLLACGSSDRTARLWDCSKNPPTLKANLTGDTDRVTSVAFHPTLPLLASGSSYNNVKLWDCSDAQNSPTLKATIVPPIKHNKSNLLVFRIALSLLTFHPTLPLLASSSSDRTVRLWDCSQNPPTLKATIPHNSIVTSVAFHPTIPLIALGLFDGTVKIWR